MTGKSLTRLAASLVAGVMLAGTAWGQDSLNIRLTSKICDGWARGHDLEFDEGRLYIGSVYDGVVIIDVTDSRNPTMIGRFLNDMRIDRLTVENNIAYVLCDSAGNDFVRLFDVTDAPDVRELSWITAPRIIAPAIGGPLVVNGLIYLSCMLIEDDEGIWGMGIWDTTDPAHPEMISFYEEPGHITDLAYHNGFVYGSRGGEHPLLEVLDVRDPRDIQLAGLTGGFLNYRSFRFYGDFLYCYYNQEQDSKFTVFDVSNPWGATRVWETDQIKQIDDMTELNGYLYVARGFNDGNGISDFNQGVAILDISNPGEPELLSIYENPDTQDLSAIESAGENLYTLSYNYSQFKVWDAAEDGSTRTIYTSTNYGDIKDIDVSGEYVYVTYDGWDGVGIGIYSMFFPDSPIFLDYISIMPSAGSPRTTISGSLLMTVGRSAPFDEGGIRLYSLEVPDHPQLIYSEGGGIYEASILGDYAYVARGRDGLQILDLSDPAHPVETASIAGYYHRIKASGDFLFATGDTAWSIRISDPEHPRRIGWFLPGDYFLSNGFDIIDGALYYGSGEIIRRSLSSANCNVVARYPTLWTGNSVRFKLIGDSLLARFNGNQGLEVYDISGNPDDHDTLMLTRVLSIRLE